MSLKVFLATSMLSASALAAEVKITNFVYSGSKIRAAEICGKVTRDVPVMEAVEIKVDPRSKSPGYYIAWTNKTGQFCTTVTSYYGEAEASLVDENASSGIVNSKGVAR